MGYKMMGNQNAACAGQLTRRINLPPIPQSSRETFQAGTQTRSLGFNGRKWPAERNQFKLHRSLKRASCERRDTGSNKNGADGGT